MPQASTRIATKIPAASLCFVLLWAYSNLFHDIGATALTGLPLNQVAGVSLASYLCCLAQPAGWVAGCAAVWAAARHRGLGRVLSSLAGRGRAACCFLAAAAVLGAVFYLGVERGALVVPTVAHMLLCAICGVLLAALFACVGKDQQRRAVVATVSAAFLFYMLLRCVVVPFLWAAPSLVPWAALHFCLLAVAAGLWHLLSPAASDGFEGAAPDRRPAFAPKRPAIHVLCFGAGFGLLHKVLGIAFSYEPLYEPLPLLAGTVGACAAALVVFWGGFRRRTRCGSRCAARCSRSPSPASSCCRS